MSLMGQISKNWPRNTIIPKNTPSGYGVAFAGTEYQMSEKDLQKYKETRGRQSYEEVHKLINTSKYRNMSDEDKAQAIKEILKGYPNRLNQYQEIPQKVFMRLYFHCMFVSACCQTVLV